MGAQPCFRLFHTTRANEVRCSDSEIITDLNDTKAERSRYVWLRSGYKAASLCLLVSYITLASSAPHDFLDRQQRDFIALSATNPTFEVGTAS